MRTVVFFFIWISACYGDIYIPNVTENSASARNQVFSDIQYTAEDIYEAVREYTWVFNDSYELIDVDPPPEGFTQDINWAATWVGTALQQYCYHILHFPGVRNLGIFIGEKLGATPIPAAYFQCNAGSVGEKKEASNIVGVWINGLNTNLRDTILAAEFISHVCGEIKVFYAYNSTNGLMADIWEHILGKLYYPTEALEAAVEAIQMAIKAVGGINSSGKVVIFAHSQGGAILERALQYLSSDERKMLQIYTFGSASLFFKTPDIQVLHIISDRDYIPFVADPVRYVIALKWAPDTVLLKHGPTWGTFANHSFFGDTYQPEVIRIGKMLKNNLLSDSIDAGAIAPPSI